MAQNIYDNTSFFSNYSHLKRSREGLDGAPEWLRLQSFLPPLSGAKVLDLGCGMGWYCRWMHEQGAASVRGIDLSQNMLDRAKEMTAAAGYHITYQRGDLDDAASLHQLLPDSDSGSYDVVFSALAVHYLTNLPHLVAQVHRILKPGGVFVFSAEHPIYTAPSGPGFVEIPAPHKDGVRRVWPLNDYQAEGLRVTNWLADGVRKYHRTVAGYINILLEAGFELTGFNEWYPTPEELEAHLDWTAETPNDMIKPTFLLVRATKKATV